MKHFELPNCKTDKLKKQKKTSKKYNKKIY